MWKASKLSFKKVGISSHDSGGRTFTGLGPEPKGIGRDAYEPGRFRDLGELA
jgi:hypothetical protein